MKKTVALLFIFLLVLSGMAMEKEKVLSLNAEEVRELKIDTGAGFLKVIGITASSQIEVRATIIIEGRNSKQEEHIFKKYVKLSLEKRRNTAYLTSRIENLPSSLFSVFSGERNARIDLTVTVPSQLKIKIKDGSGDLELSSIEGEVDIDDGSGKISVNDTKGPLKIHDGSGSISIRKAKGEINVSDGSGSIDLENLIGNLSLDDGSGEINVDEIKGNVDIDDGSGSMNIRNVDGDVVIRDGSGGIYVNHVTGDVEIRRNGSGTVSIKNVEGTVHQ